jgi:hypothetical protein
MSQTETDFFADAAPEPILLDRSTLEDWAECPAMAWGKAHLLTMPDCSEPATAGSEGHDVISHAMTARIAGCSYGEMIEYLRIKAGESRPDVQPEVCTALAIGARTIAGRICYQEDGEERHPDDIRRYDGGHGERRGQLAMDFQHGEMTYRLTGELDLLMSTIAPTVLDLDDWKMGRKWWTPTDVAASFQFQFYAELVFRNYPDAQQVNVRVHMPAMASSTEPVEFRQKDRARIRARIATALATYHEYASKPSIEAIPAYPLPEKCAWCPLCVPGKCPMVRRDAREVPPTPEGMLEALIATEAAATRMRGLLTQHVRDTGLEVQFGQMRFGPNKPAAKRAKAMDMYEAEEAKGER